MSEPGGEAGTPARASSGPSEIALRLLTAAVLIPAVLYCVYAGGLWVVGAVMALVLLGMRELYGLLAAKGARAHQTFGLAAGAALPVIAYFGNEYHATLLMTAALLAVMVAEVGKEEIGEALGSISGTFFGVFYVGWLLSHAIPLRNFHYVVTARWGAEVGAAYPPQTGAFLLVVAVAIVVGCDAGAYFAGRAFGRRKLAPTISPGKTVEGAIGGVAAGTAIAVGGKATCAWLAPALATAIPWSIVVPLGILVSIAGVVGDLVESLLKRDAAQKDAGALLPGMGGVLDRIDSALFGIPVMYYLLLGNTFLHVGLR